MCTVLVPFVQWFDMASTGNIPVLPVFELVLCLYHCPVCTVLVPLVQCSGMVSTGSVPILPVLVLVLCVYHCTVCTVFAHLAQCFGMGNPGDVRILVFGLACCTCSATHTNMMHRSCDGLKSYVVGCLYPTCTDAIVRLPVCTADCEVGSQPRLIYTLYIVHHRQILLYNNLYLCCCCYKQTHKQTNTVPLYGCSE